MRWLLVLLVGAVLGAGAAASDVAAGGLGQTATDRAFSMVLNAGFVWAGLAVLAGHVVAGRSSVWHASVAGFAALTDVSGVPVASTRGDT